MTFGFLFICRVIPFQELREGAKVTGWRSRLEMKLEREHVGKNLKVS